METVLIVIHLLLAIGLIGLVLVQHGKGADMGAAFGSGSSATVFGAAGAGNFLSRATAVLAALFFATSLVMAYFAMQKHQQTDSIMQAPAATAPAKVPAKPASQSDVPPVPQAATATSDVPPVPKTPAASNDAPPVPATAVPATGSDAAKTSK